MPRPKGSASVKISAQQLEAIVGDGGLVCVSKAWLRKLGFDADIGQHAELLGVHADGKQMWSYSEWASEEIMLRAYLDKHEQWVENDKKDIRLARKKSHSDSELRELWRKAKGLSLISENDTVIDREAFIARKKELLARKKKRLSWYKKALDDLKS